MTDVDNLKERSISSNFFVDQNSPKFSRGPGINQDIHIPKEFRSKNSQEFFT